MNIFEKLYQELRKKYKAPNEQWNLWLKRPKTEQEKEKVMISAILTQRTSWKNVELALENLKNKKIISLKDIYCLGSKKIAYLIKSVGFYEIKAQYLFNLSKFIIENYGNLEKLEKYDLKELREKLLKVKGIGPETADSILLYALDKPIFVIDEYTKRLVKKRNLSDKIDYQFLQKLFEENLKKDFCLYQDFHALIVINGKNKN
ncbi:endonuclease [Candidatus Kuenenbacteria bacterium HGW-Kuenenbacteria-1]|uniref:Endonuclease n=1 Tax=Candidatus Kuenenbacteria bacterium HGW-Kuenenbacteria-1 TaxID=2013812 RepID=A0A2N1UNV5_9BACT|nr:MAG: endonuclease [Candidatus Kuenenbacteria bacterium HGW-Kuenenbacteria-1]